MGVCLGDGAACFYAQLQNSSNFIGCDCLSDCVETKLSTVVDTYNLDALVSAQLRRLINIIKAAG